MRKCYYCKKKLQVAGYQGVYYQGILSRSDGVACSGVTVGVLPHPLLYHITQEELPYCELTVSGLQGVFFIVICGVNQCIAQLLLLQEEVPYFFNPPPPPAPIGSSHRC